MILLIATLQRNIATQWNTGVVRMIIEPVTIRTIRTAVFVNHGDCPAVSWGLSRCVTSVTIETIGTAFFCIPSSGEE